MRDPDAAGDASGWAIHCAPFRAIAPGGGTSGGGATRMNVAKRFDGAGHGPPSPAVTVSIAASRRNADRRSG